MCAEKAVIMSHSLLFLWRKKIEQMFQIVFHLRTDTSRRHTDTHQEGMERLSQFIHLSICVHVIVILLIITRGYIVKPLLVIKIPAYGFLNALLELQTGLPTEFFLQFC